MEGDGGEKRKKATWRGKKRLQGIEKPEKKKGKTITL